ncbi:MAG: DUF3419 family protein, partial [Spirochaetes bacterium]|nr:DUF3419 family protein [Spirochaetota bacterium]
MKNNKIYYSQVWEDPASIRYALDITNSDVVLSITGAGDNVLNLLLDNPKQIIAIDTNKAQNYLLKLKIAAIKTLTYDEFINLFGIKIYNYESNNKINFDCRLSLFNKLVPYLDIETKTFFLKNKSIVIKGIQNCGKLEKYLKFYIKLFRIFFKIDFLNAYKSIKSIKNQIDIYNKNINENLLIFINNLVINKFILCLVKGIRSFKYVKNENFAKNLLEKFKTLFFNKSIKDNYFLSSFFLSAYIYPDALPPYLQKNNYNKLKNMVKKINIIDSGLLEYIKQIPKNSIDKFNLSNIFEWISENEFEEYLEHIYRISNNNARLFCMSTFTGERKLNKKFTK